ncbi:hypothetical protein [Paraburkholderia saeva]|uniref:Uncharacterized protein n=1 Tax=Paraburkholderia saeva TaxID=2777537 RepID=A0A9N8S2V8_9BURK|nr:hypothetical protein [Paraburkholderia saeva]CAG4928279.1 hypothetical protein LMG31841_05800 [Paraburkholderia saeva]
MAAQAAAQFGTALFGGGQAPEVASNQPFNPFTTDDSGWAVNFGSGTASAQPNPVSQLAQGLANSSQNVTSDPMMMIAALAVVALIFHKGK